MNNQHQLNADKFLQSQVHFSTRHFGESGLRLEYLRSNSNKYSRVINKELAGDFSG